MAKILILGGSGFLSGTMARQALAAGDEVCCVTRGNRPLPAGARPITADRKDRNAFAAAVRRAGETWDLVIDSIGFTADDARQDLDCFSGRCAQLVFISTDFVISPVDRPWRIDETYDRYQDSPYGSGKRAAERVLLGSHDLPVTILRPCHIYGPGSLLGCLPRHGRDKDLIARMKRGDALELVGGGHFLQQPVLAADLWRLVRSCLGNPSAHGQIYFAPGPEIVESREFYRILAEILGTPCEIVEVPLTDHLREHPEHQSFCTHRVYSDAKARSHGLALPATPLRVGLRSHVDSIMSESRV